MTSPTGSDAACHPTRIVSGAIHHVDPERSLHAPGKINEWDVVANAFRRHLEGHGTAQDHFHFTEAPGMCPVATPVDFTQVRAIVYPCGIPVRSQPDPAIDVVKVGLARENSMFFLAERGQAEDLERAWTAHQAGEAQERFDWDASVRTGNLLRRTRLLVVFDRIRSLTRAPLP